MPTRTSPRTGRGATLLLCAIVALGLALRIAGAQGGLWLDEAWSAVLAHEAGTPAGVFLQINHDNNHHLNSLWLQAVGLGAPSWLMRALSIATGTLAIPVAAALARPRGRVAEAVAAILFATSPMLVTLGSEARGYAPMTLALLVATLFVDRTLAGDARYRRPLALRLCFVLGALSQLTMVFGVLALCGWAFFAWWRRESFGVAVRRSLALFAGPLVALAATLALVFGAAWASPTGFQFGSYEPFSTIMYLHALVEMVGYTVGWPVVTIALPVLALVLLVLAPRAGASRVAFYRLAIFGFPVAMAVLQAGNPGHPRYYLLAAVALLLMLGEVIAHGLGRGGRWRVVAGASLIAIVVGGLVQDVDLAINRRGDPARAIPALAARAPKGTTVLMDRATGEAMLRVAAAQAGYPLRIVKAPCPAAPFVFADRFKGETLPAMLVRCRTRYLPIAGAQAHGLSGTHWTLYARAP
ncbi:hypothetical protein [Sphingomonas sp.]|uniref:hypothetical protein n=1 Tax=Sphingomonas sp. TaxID=28214 RepID=UPI0035BBB658